MKKDFTVVTDTPVYVQNVISALNLSEVSVSLTFQAIFQMLLPHQL